MQRAFRIAPDHPYATHVPPSLIERSNTDDGVALTRVQADAIGAFRLIQLVGLEIEKLTGEYAACSRRSPNTNRSSPITNGSSRSSERTAKTYALASNPKTDRIRGCGGRGIRPRRTDHRARRRRDHLAPGLRETASSTPTANRSRRARRPQRAPPGTRTSPNTSSPVRRTMTFSASPTRDGSSARRSIRFPRCRGQPRACHRQSTEAQGRRDGCCLPERSGLRKGRGLPVLRHRQGTREAHCIGRLPQRPLKRHQRNQSQRWRRPRRHRTDQRAITYCWAPPTACRSGSMNAMPGSWGEPPPGSKASGSPMEIA